MNNPISQTKISVEHSVTDEFVEVRFVVKSDIKAQVSRDFNLVSFDNMGLWNFDVCEVFIKGEDASNYLELQCSPLAQKLALNIIKPREVVEPASPNNTFISAIETSDGFECKFLIARSDIPGMSKNILGNFFCCLGKENTRSFFAVNINSDEKADFHRPELFMRIS